MNIKIGDSYSEQFKITKEMVIRFAELTGDKNPIHLDPDYAKNTRFGECIVPGILIAGLLSKIIGMDFPGNGSIYLWQDLNFLAPVYLDDIIEITCVVEFIDEKGHVLIDNLIKNNENKIVIRGKSKVKVL